MIPIECLKCGLSSQRGEMESHRLNICPEEIINCIFKGCDTKLQRKLLKDHLKEESGMHIYYQRMDMEEQLTLIDQKFEKELKIRDEKN